MMSANSPGNLGGPVQIDPGFRELRLKIRQELGVLPNLSRNTLIGSTKRDQLTHCFANAPFNRMQPITPICDVCGAEIFASRQEILDPCGYECPKWNLERKRTHIDVIVPAR